MQLLIKNAQVMSTPEFRGDVLVEDGKIVALGQDLVAAPAAKVLDAAGQMLLPGLIDVHVHFREPGFTEKETIATGAKAAAHGGFTTVCAMPNLKPVPDNVETLEMVEQLNEENTLIHVKQFSAITKNLTSQENVEYQELVNAGAIGFSNDGFGVQDAQTMLQAMNAIAATGTILAAHIEDESLKGQGVINAGSVAQRLNLPGISNQVESAQLARDLELVRQTGVHYHACHISTSESLALIRQAKQEGLPVTVEAAPHHLLLNETDIVADNPQFKMNPPLRSVADQLALQEALLDGTIDVVATDHAPHTEAEKTGSFQNAAFGIVGIETSFALMYTNFVRTQKMTLQKLVELMSAKPAEIFGLAGGVIAVGQPADLTLVDVTTPYQIDATTWFSKGKNSPFIGAEVYGQVQATIVGGELVYQEQEDAK